MSTVNESSTQVAERRGQLRLAGGGEVQAVMLDRHDHPLAALHDVRVLNISAGGAALLTSTSVQTGDILSITAVSAQGTGEERTFKIRALDCSAYDESQNKIRGKLVAGRIPAALLYKW